jgi:hypothetical protein
MRQFNVRVDDAFYEEARAKADEMGISLSDFVRDAVKQWCHRGDTEAISPDGTYEPPDWLKAELRHKNEQIVSLQTELSRQTEQFTGELSLARQSTEDASKRSDTIIAQMTQQLSQMTQQLERTQLQLTDLRERRRWWQRVFAGRASEAS